MATNRVRLLALDGGGVRGLSSLMILQQLMATINAECPPKPCDYFDMIGGTSTGGLIAIMLGRLRMTVEECIYAYTSLSDRVFEKRRHRVTIKGKIQGRFDAIELERAVKEILRDRGLDQDALLKDEPDARCKVSTHLLAATKIWQACRATSAATSFFDPIAIGPFGEEFVDGALGANNPIFALWSQAQDVWGGDLWAGLKCLVSIGTGVPPLQPLGDDIQGIFSTLKDIATETERTDEYFRRDKPSLADEGRYFRFNVNHGLESIGLEESKKKKEIAAATGRYTTLQATVKQIEACASKLAERKLQRCVQYILDSDDQACLRNLQTTNPNDDKDRIMRSNGGLLKDAYRWILDNGEFRQWCNEPSTRLLWIKGDPGKGKTMLLCGIINELANSVPDTTAISFFFCQATDVRINNATAVLRGLIYLIIDKQPHLISHIRRQYKYTGKQLFEGVNAWEALSKIFFSILEDPLLQCAYLIIDALDECTADLPLLLDLVTQTSSACSHVRWIVSSRNGPIIEEFLNTASLKATLSLELNEKCVSEAVVLYIQNKVRELTRIKKYKNEIRDAVSSHLLANANGTFLWVALVCNKLAEERAWNTRKLLTAFPPTLKSLYKQMLDQLRGSEDAELCKCILGVVLSVCRPITLDELPALLPMPKDVSDDRESLKGIIRLCGSFLALHHREDTIFFVHKSAKDFLLEHASDEIFPRGIGVQHSTIFSRSLRVMYDILRRDVYNIKSPGYPIEKVKCPDSDPVAAVRYSCVYWVDHLGDSDSHQTPNPEIQDSGFLDVFLQQKYLYWLEALSLLRSLSEGIAAMLKLDTLLQKIDKPQALLMRVQDASRFIRYHRRAIESSPLQVYSSSLIFSPSHSMTKVCYTKEMPNWVLNAPAMEEDWSPCLQTLEGHDSSVPSIAWSHDGSRLASGSIDHTVRIWDPATGHSISTLKGHCELVRSIAWSPDGDRLASASYDKTLRIWDPVSGKCITTFKGHGDSVWSICWSPDGHQLASGSHDHTVRIWDLPKDQCIATLKGHTDLVTAIIWLQVQSQDQSRLVSASSDNTIRIWDLLTKQCISTLGGHSNLVWSIALSQEGTRLASASFDKTLRIWDLATGHCTFILKGHSHRVYSVAWSQNGCQLASGSDDKTIRIWDPANGQCISTLKGHLAAVTSIAWSPDGIRLASGSKDKSVRIWDPIPGQCILTLEGHGYTVCSVSWSRNGSRLASSAYDSTIRIWDPTADQANPNFRFEGHSDWVRSIAWSQDGNQLASGSHDKTVRIWDPATGQCTSKFEGHSDSVTSISWSRDRSLLASASVDCTIMIWHLATERCIFTLEGHSGSVTSIAWSHDGSRLASASNDGTIRIWDPLTARCTSTLNEHSEWVWSIAWSQDGRRLACGSTDKTVKLWDLTTKQCTLTLDVASPGVLQFDEVNLNHLHTSVGVFNLNSAVNATISPNRSASLPRQMGYGLRNDRTWITFGGEDVLWLPSEHRPASSSSFAISSTAIAIGCSSGRVLIFALSKDCPPL